MTGALVAAVISVCVASLPCERHDLRIERKMCGQHSRAAVPLNGEWRPAEARVTCSR